MTIDTEPPRPSKRPEGAFTYTYRGHTFHGRYACTGSPPILIVETDFGTKSAALGDEPAVDIARVLALGLIRSPFAGARATLLRNHFGTRGAQYAGSQSGSH